MALGSDTSTEVSQTRLLLAGYKTHRSTAQQVKQPPIAEISPLAAGWFKQRRKILNLHELSWQSKEVSWAGLFTSCTMTYTWWESFPVTPTHLETLWRRDSEVVRKIQKQDEKLWTYAAFKRLGWNVGCFCLRQQLQLPWGFVSG